MSYCLFHQNITSYAEIGVKFGATAKAVQTLLPNCNIDLYEKSSKFCKFLEETMPEAKIYRGSAEFALKGHNTIYDLVYFDASHHYDIDIRLLNALIPHLTPNTTIIFDDYGEFPDVKKLVDEFEPLNICKVIKII